MDLILFETQVVHGDVGALAQEFQADGATDACGSSGDDGILSREKVDSRRQRHDDVRGDEAIGERSMEELIARRGGRGDGNDTLQRGRVKVGEWIRYVVEDREGEKGGE